MMTSLTAHSDSSTLQAEAQRVSAQLNELRVLLRDQARTKAEAKFVEEQKTLQRRFLLVSCWLTVLTLALVVTLGALVAGLWSPAQPVLSAVVATVAGTLGSALSALISALQRRANGWETQDGSRYPFDEEKSERFSLAMSPILAGRPALGATTGLLVLIGWWAGVFSLASTGAEVNRVAFWAFLAGLFAKTLIEKLKTTFDQLVGK